MILFRRMNKDATIPVRSSEGAAGFDLYYSGLSMSILPKEYAVCETGIQMSLSPDLIGDIKPRSGLAVKYGIDTMAGVIDSDYRGEIKVVLINHGKETAFFRRGDRIAQLVVTNFYSDVQEVTEDLDTTARGVNGFGSTGR